MTAQQPQRAGNQVVQYQQPQPPVQRPVAPPSAPQQTMQPAQYQQTQNVQPMQPQQPPIYHDPTATFVDPEEPFRNNSLMGAIRGQASFRATFLWWIVGFFFFGFFAVQGGIAIAIIPMAIWWNWGSITQTRL